MSLVKGLRHSLRNVGIIAHINAGKTTTTERILFHAGTTDTVGDVDRGNTVTDYLIQERDRGITITSAAVSYNWKKHLVNLIDTPGHVDFTIEVERSLSVLDGAVTLLDASAGVEAQTITVWNQATKYKLPNVIFINKCDKPQADYGMCLKDLKRSLNISAALIQLPVYSGGGFNSIVDIINRHHISWPAAGQDHGSKFACSPVEEAKVDAKTIEQVEKNRERLINYLCDMDDELSSHVLDCDKISQVSGELLNAAVRRATLRCQLSPVLVGSSFKYIGVQQLMDAINSFLPSPVERTSQLERLMSEESRDSRTNCAFIFKIMHDKRLGPLTYLKVCSGSVSKLQRVYNMDSGAQEQIKRVYRPFADELKEMDQPSVKDDIVVVTGITQSRTGDIIGDADIAHHEGAEEGAPTGDQAEVLPFRLLNGHIIVPKINTMEPVYFCSIESRLVSGQLKMERALECLAREDPSFTYEIDSLGAITIRGMGKLHLEILRDRIKSEHGVEAMLGPLQISYRESIDGEAVEELAVDRLVNSVRSVLKIRLRVGHKAKAGAWGPKRLRLDGRSETLSKLRADFRGAIENGIQSTFAHGPVLGFPVIDCDVMLLDFSANGRCSLPVISSASAQCLSRALARCSPLLLEPMMLLEVATPEAQSGKILADLTSARRAVVLSSAARLNGSLVIRAESPLASLADYSEFLRIATSGRGSYSMELCGYRPMSDSERRNVARL